MRAWPPGIVAAVAVAALAACGDDGGAPPDADPTAVTTAHCEYVPVAATAGSGGTVTAGALEAGAADVVLRVPVGTALGGYTSRAGAAGNAGVVDERDPRISDGFNASIGVESAPRVKALALTAGGETVIILKLDAIFVYEEMVYDLEDRLGAAYHGKILVTASHSHSAWMQFTRHSVLIGGGGNYRDHVYRGFLDSMEDAARAALAAQRPAKIGFAVDDAFDLDDQINRDRRGENDDLPGGDRAEDRLVLVRVDGTDDVPIAIMTIFGEHGTLMDDVNPMASTDAPGAIERVMEQQFDDHVVVMHVQSAGGDTSPVGHGDLDCGLAPGDPDDPCLPFAKLEGHGRAAAPTLMAAWQAAGATMDGSIELEMLTRSIELGPKPETFTTRDGALAYAPFDLTRQADGVVYDGSGALISPIDEFNAPVGVALCETAEPTFPAGQMPGTSGLVPYGGCVRLDVATEVLGALLKLESEVDATHVACQTTRTSMSALRIGDYVLGTLPGEVTRLIADDVRAHSPVDDAHTVVVGYAQGHVGYILEPEDWLKGGYEPSITFWGPLEGAYLVDRLADLMPLAMTPAREDGTADGTDRVDFAPYTDDFPIDDPAPMAGTVPATVDADLWVRGGLPAQAQPAAQVPRVGGIATFVWNGDDPVVAMPVVTLERETSPGVFAAVTRRNGAPVQDGDLLVEYTPSPLRRGSASDPQRHVYAVEWQAVPWLGAPGLDDLADRGGVPLGRYRFHVVGATWTLDSDPFEVVAGGVTASVARAGAVLTATVQLDAPRGWRLLDLAAPSNRPVPVSGQDVTVDLLDAGGAVLDSRTLTTTAAGQVSVDDPDVVTATRARFTDRFGNAVTVTL
ncbi:MAG: neutral/alkaline non-lysosomal ceramidase N-terminal domain-containing protein [Myxococcales bacterium]|nr:neutral/alkaline non-lysosomal ceramidase N-terminal domain-containing protein [Myxococcales bacterium]